MKKAVYKLAIVVLIGLVSGCGIFNSGCKCPKVSYNSYPKR